MKIPVILKIQAQGADAIATATKAIDLPCTPFEGMGVDGHRVILADFCTLSGKWELTLKGYNQTHGDAIQHLEGLLGETVGDGGKTAGRWQVTVEKKNPITVKAAS
jgi:hypothetical protein